MHETATVVSTGIAMQPQGPSNEGCLHVEVLGPMANLAPPLSDVLPLADAVSMWERFLKAG